MSGWEVGLAFEELGLWVGLFFSLAIFSALAGDHWLARLAQHILVGVALGYVAVVTVREVLQPRLLVGLLRSSMTDLNGWAPLLLGLFLWLAGVDYLWSQGQPPSPVLPLWRRALRLLGALPVALMLGVGVGVGILGLLQGTLLPQAWRVAITGPTFSTPNISFISGLSLLVLTTATFAHLTINVNAHLAHQPALVQSIFRVWLWIGQRALWVATGVIFARLAAARFSLLISRFDYFLQGLTSTGLWTYITTFWETLAR
jgi:hypothetical protein